MEILHDEPNDALTDSESFKYKMKTTGNTFADGNIKDSWNICASKIFKHFLENPWNTIN